MHASSELQVWWVHGGPILQGHCAVPLLHQLVKRRFGLWAEGRWARRPHRPIQLDQPKKVIGEGSSAAPGPMGLSWEALGVGTMKASSLFQGGHVQRRRTVPFR